MVRGWWGTDGEWRIGWEGGGSEGAVAACVFPRPGLWLEAVGAGGSSGGKRRGTHRPTPVAGSVINVVTGVLRRGGLALAPWQRGGGNDSQGKGNAGVCPVLENSSI